MTNGMKGEKEKRKREYDELQIKDMNKVMEIVIVESYE